MTSYRREEIRERLDIPQPYVCPDCGGIVSGYVPIGAHSPRLMRAECGHLRAVTCAGRPVNQCAECEGER